MLAVGISIFALVILNGCSNAQTAESVDSKTTDNFSENDVIVTYNRATEFLKDFQNSYSNYELLDYVEGFEENSPILLVIVAESKENGSSSTLFILDENGSGQVVLASDSFATYRKKDELSLNGNVISLSLNLTASDSSVEIHDFEITVTQENEDGVFNTLYSSKELIR